MPVRWHQVKVWRERAEELRRVANCLAPPAKDHLLHSAEDYLRMADEQERKLKEEGIPAPS